MFKTVADKVQYLKINCGKTTLLLHAILPGETRWGFKRLLCNSWLCRKCRIKRTRIWCNRVSNYFKNDRISILTLTFDRTFSIDEAFANSSRCFNRFRTQLTRQMGKFMYVKVIEPQPKSGYPHFHILVNRYLPHRILKSIAISSGFGKVLDIREVPGHEAQYYVRKYLTKPWAHAQALQIFTDLRSRRCSGSHGFSLTSHARTRYKCLGPRRDYNVSARCTSIRNKLDPRYTPSLISEVHNSDWSCLSVRYWGLAPRVEPLMPVHPQQSLTFV